MKRKRHTPEQIVKKLRTASEELGRGSDIGSVCRKLEISEATYHRWKKQFEGAELPTVKRLKELEKENARLKKLVAEQALDMDMLKEINRGKW
jgi:putative transposase